MRGEIKRDLTEGSIPKNLIWFCFPVFLSALLQALYGSADAVIVGRFSSLGDIVGVTQGSQCMNIITQGISGISTGACVLIGQYLGAKKQEDADRTISTVFTLFVLTGVALAVGLQFFNGALASLMQISPEAVPAFKAYLRICEAGIPFIFMYNCISAVLQALGDSRHPLIFVGISCTLNVFLDLALIAGFGLGAKGAAVATVFAQLVSVVLSVVFLRKRRFSFDFRPASFRLYRDKAGKILKLGMPYAVQRVLVYSSFTAISGLANVYGLEAGSAAGIVAKINTFATIPFSAFNIGVATICAQCCGKRDIRRATRTMLTGLLLCLISGGALFALCQLFPRRVLSLFTTNGSLIEIGVPFLRGYSWEYVIMPFTWSIHGLFAGCGHTVIPSVDGILASVVFRTPLALFFSRTVGMGYGGISFGASMAVFGAVVSAWTVFFSGIWKRKKLFDKHSGLIGEG